MGPGRAGVAPTSGPGWVRMLKNKAHGKSGRDPFGPGMGSGRAPGSDPGEGLDGTPRDSNRLLGLSEFQGPRIQNPFFANRASGG